jgi:hypothetical protein
MGQLFEIRLTSGRYIHLEQLYQYRTYAGLMEGLPPPELNQDLIRDAVGFAEGNLLGGGQPFLIQPVERDLAVSEEVRQRYPYPLRKLPSVVCLAAFESVPPARDQTECYSFLKIVWFQEEFALPIDPEVEKQIREVDWNRLAVDVSD